MTNPAEYITGRTVQEQMNELISYVDTRAAEVATSAIASDVADVAQAKTDAESARDAAIAAKDTAVATVSDCVKKTPAAAQTITGQDLIVSGADVEAVDLRASGNATVGGTLAVTGKGTIATAAATDATSTIVNMAYVSDTGGSLNNLMHREGAETASGIKTFTAGVYNNGTWSNKSTQNISVTWRRIYYNASGATSNQALILLVTPNKPAVDGGLYGILMVGGNAATPVCKWLLKGSSITDANFVTVYSSSTGFEIWHRSVSSNDGVSFIRLSETTWGTLGNYWTADDATTDANFDYTTYTAYKVSS